MKKNILIVLTATAGLLASCVQTNEKIVPVGLQTEYLENPIGIDTKMPRFTWKYAGEDTTFIPSRYEIRIGTSPTDLKVYDERIELKPETRYYWQVTVWDQDGNPCRTSDVARFELGKGENADWQAKWITDDKDKEYEPAPMFRKGFMVDKPVKQARLYVSAAGYYEMFLNGKRVGENFLDPGYTHFDKRNLYVTHDVTSLLQKGDNAVAAVLGNGWYNEQSVAVWNFHEARWRDRPRLLSELRIDYEDGTQQTLSSDASWKTACGPYT